MVGAIEWGVFPVAILCPGGNGQSDYDPGQGRVNPGLEYRKPQHQPQQHVGQGAHDPQAIEKRETSDGNAGDEQRLPGEALGIEQRDDHDGTEIVEHRQGHQKHPQRRGHTLAEQREHCKGQYDIGGGGHGPAVSSDSLGAIDQQIDQCRQQHTAYRGDAGECHLLDRAQQTAQHFAFELDPHQQKEEHHQPIVDPQNQRLVDAQSAYLH